ncbi:MAG TPA: hypothetical protein VMS81_07975 [Methanomicrobiales archaeon]|jgi:hypothetical protein|nr:hypothetical protein [Methanomicrobiales archaeon]
MEQDALDTLGLREPVPILAGILLLLFILPVLIGVTCGSTAPTILGFVVSVLLLQGLAPTVGIGLGLPVPHLLLIMTSVAFGAIIGILRICDLFSEKSEPVARWIGKIKGTMEKYRFLSMYGQYMLIPIMWVPGIGLYGTPVIAWVLHWRGFRALALMLAGWLIACLAVIGVITEILSLLHF